MAGPGSKVLQAVAWAVGWAACSVESWAATPVRQTVVWTMADPREDWVAWPAREEREE